MAVVDEARAEAMNEERWRTVEEKTVLSCTTFNVLAPIYKRMGVESERESACQHVWRERNQEIIKTLLDTKSSILCLQECWLANSEWVDMYDTALQGAGYQLLKLPRTNARGDGLMMAVRASEWEVVDHHPLCFNDCGDRVAQIVRLRARRGGRGEGNRSMKLGEVEEGRWGTGEGRGEEGEGGEEVVVANTHLLFPHNANSSIVRLCQVYKLLERIDGYREEHHAGALPVILCGDLNGTKQGNVYKLLRAHGFVSSFDSAHHHSDDDEQWVSHRNHHGNLCGVDYVWVLNPEQHHRTLAVNWRTAVFGLIRSKLASAGITNVEAAFDFFLRAGEGHKAMGPLAHGGRIFPEGGAAGDQAAAAFNMGDFQRGLDRLGLTGVDSIGLTRIEVEELMRSADCQGKGCVDFEDFKALFDQPTWDDTVAALRHSLATSCSADSPPPPAESTAAGAADVHSTTSDISSASTDITITSPDISITSPDISITSPDISMTSADISITSPDISITSADISSPGPLSSIFLICTYSAISRSSVALQIHSMGEGGKTEGRVGGTTEGRVKEQLGRGTMQGSSGREGGSMQLQGALNLDVLQATLFPRAMEDGVWPEDYTISDHAVLTRHRRVVATDDADGGAKATPSNSLGVKYGSGYNSAAPYVAAGVTAITIPPDVGAPQLALKSPHAGAKFWRKVLRSPGFKDMARKRAAQQRSMSFQQFDLLQLTRATRNFSKQNFIGKGSTSEVYRGAGPNGAQWAVKRSVWRQGGGDGPMLTFRPANPAAYAELEADFIFSAKSMAVLCHQNVIQLLGYCFECGERVLIYEFVGGPSLESMIFGNTDVWKEKITMWRRGSRNARALMDLGVVAEGEEEGIPFDFLHRLLIAVDIAEAVAYLHTEFPRPYLLEGLHPKNIFFDTNGVPKVGNIGRMKVLMSRDITGGASMLGGLPHAPTLATSGYIDPSFNITRKSSPPNDVYAFGVILLQIFTGRPAVIENEPGEATAKLDLGTWVSKRLRSGGDAGIGSIVDPRLGTAYPADVIRRVLQVGLDCQLFPAKKRPAMKRVAERLLAIHEELVKEGGVVVVDIPEPEPEAGEFVVGEEEGGKVSVGEKLGERVAEVRGEEMGEGVAEVRGEEMGEGVVEVRGEEMGEGVAEASRKETGEGATEVSGEAMGEVTGKVEREGGGEKESEEGIRKEDAGERGNVGDSGVGGDSSEEAKGSEEAENRKRGKKGKKEKKEKKDKKEKKRKEEDQAEREQVEVGVDSNV
ncbi:unnamed protein product [Closterium sp. NIES-64]|nr:unnamed protein product [Closterium sp. NIES-64]